MPTIVSRELGVVALEDLEVRALGDRDVRVRIEASGICHSDLAVVSGELPGVFPVALGHEGAGTVIEIGRAVESVAVGDRVVLSAVPSCGGCWFCSRGEFALCARSHALRRPTFVDETGPIRGTSGLGTFSDMIVVDERAAVPVRTDLPAEQLSLIGCAVLTGAGTVFNIADVRPGASVLVVGAGGIGLAAVQAARVAGALPIAVIDPWSAARERALACGASVAVDPADAAGLADLTGGRGFDVVVECVASTATVELAWSLTRRGGEIVLVGVTPDTERFPFSMIDVVLSGRRLTGCVYGGSSVQRDIPRYVAMAEAGEFDFAAMVGAVVSLDEAPAVLLADDRPPGRTVIIPRHQGIHQ